MACLSAGLFSRSLTSAAKSAGKQQSGFLLVSSSNSIPIPHHNKYKQLLLSVTTSNSRSYLSSFASYAPDGKSAKVRFSKQGRNVRPLTLSPLSQLKGFRLFHCRLSNRYQNVTLRLSSSKDDRMSRIKWVLRHKTWIVGGCSTGICIYSSSATALAEGYKERNGESFVCSSHGKEVYRDYSITGIPGDGRCLFRSVAHGACIRMGNPIPDESLQRKLADELRNQVADEFIKRRTETEWFIEGDFDTYVSHMRKPHVWGGEPELLMASHVLQMPITVYMHDKDSGGLIEIAEYGQEYGKEDPIRVLYHGFGHYDAVHFSQRKNVRSKL